MRLWTIHPSYLDPQCLTALWRETLLAKNILLGLTKGYKNHPQLNRFKNHINPLKAINCYLSIIWEEANSRNYAFDKTKFTSINLNEIESIKVNTGQIQYELSHLMKKLKDRSPDWYTKFNNTKSQRQVLINPLFSSIHGGIESWEKLS